MTNSRRKGKVGELELAKVLTDLGWPARRSQQFCGANGDADVICDALPWLSCEVKRREQISQLHSWVAKARIDAPPETLGTVFHRKNNCDWLVTMHIDDWAALVRNVDTEGFG